GSRVVHHVVARVERAVDARRPYLQTVQRILRSPVDHVRDAVAVAVRVPHELYDALAGRRDVIAVVPGAVRVQVDVIVVVGIGRGDRIARGPAGVRQGRSVGP